MPPKSPRKKSPKKKKVAPPSSPPSSTKERYEWLLKKPINGKVKEVKVALSCPDARLWSLYNRQLGICGGFGCIFAYKLRPENFSARDKAIDEEVREEFGPDVDPNNLVLKFMHRKQEHTSSTQVTVRYPLSAYSYTPLM